MRRHLLLAALLLGGCYPRVGFLAQPIRFYGGHNPVAAIPSDINGDGKLDLLVTKEWSRGELAVMLGNGDGTFQLGLNLITGYAPKRPVLEDVNGDGKKDLIVMDLVEGGYVSVLLGNGDGSFAAPVNYLCGRSPSSLRAADLNGDGKVDLVLVNSRPDDFGNAEYLHGNLTILFNRGDGTFSAPDTRDLGMGPRAVASDDLNSDGKLDLIVADDASHLLYILQGTGNGRFEERARYRIPFGGMGVTTADFNHDGKVDLAVGASGVSIFFGHGDGTFEPGGDYPLDMTRNSTVGDMDGDGNIDIVAARRFLKNDGTGHFTIGGSIDADNDDSGVAAGDFNGDGMPDLVVTDRTHSRIGVYLNTLKAPPKVSLASASSR